jgi:hypothetical protein
MNDQSPWPDQKPGDGDPGETNAPSGTSPDIQWFAERFRAARDKRKEWIDGGDDGTGADGDFGFVAGFQWDADDVEYLTAQGRVPITFNRTSAYIDSVSGLEVNNRQEVRFIPRTNQPGPAGVSELATGAVKWSRDDCDAEDEESNAFYDCIVCGEGWTQTTMNYDDDPDGLIIVEQRDPRNIYPDPDSRKANYADARFVFYVQDMDRDKAENMFPDADPSLLDAMWARDTEDEGEEPVNRRLSSLYKNNVTGDSSQSRTVRIVEAEWFEYEVAHRVVDATTGARKHMSADEFSAYSQAHEDTFGTKPKSVRDKRKKFYRAILGQTVLAESNGPARGGFTLKAITGKRDRKKRQWYGLVRAMRDPQMWSNKFLSQIIHIINSNAKGGLFAEVGAFVNAKEAQEEYAQPNSITMLQQGGLARIQQKEPPQLPAGLQFLMQYAVSAVSDAVGSNPEMMGQADRAQAGVVEEHRKQSAMTIFAGLFANFRRYRKEQGRLHLWFIQEFISDGRLIRIGGPDDAKFVPLVRDAMLGEYDLVVDDQPTSPNMKERTWGAILSLFPVLSKMELPPQVMMTLMQYSPLPSTLVSKVSGMIPPPQQGPSPQQQAEMQKMQAEGALLQAKAQREQALSQGEQAKVQMIPIDVAEKQARVELLRAQAINALGQVQMDHNDAAFQQAMASIDALVQVAGAHQDAMGQAHDQAMAQQQAAQSAQAQQHSQGLAEQQQSLAEQQAAQPQRGGGQ